jgi:hypothetical protein
MKDAGYRIQVNNINNLAEIKEKYQVPFMLQSCHTAIVDGYIIEGHVPAADLERLLAERPDDIAGLAVPGMPIGSPGMEGNGNNKEAYEVIAFDAAGNTHIYSRYIP